MTTTNPTTQVYEPYVEHLPWYLRTMFAGIAVTLATLLITAACLTPSPKGYGTHQQLGLPPCTFQVMFDGKPCPSCGMTTSWSHLMRGHVFSSFQANPGGTLLAITSLVLAPWLFMSAVKGTWFIGVPPTWLALTVAITLLSVTFGNWIIQLIR